MEQVSNKLRDLTSVFDSLYYDYDEYQERLWNAEAYKLGSEDASKKEKINIAKEMLKKDFKLNIIRDLTKLSLREIRKIKNEMKLEL